MVKKTELLKKTLLFKKSSKVDNIKVLINELFKHSDIQAYYLSSEITLIVYNFLINSFKKISAFELKQYTISVIENLYSKILSLDEILKVEMDINYIVEHKLYYLVSDLYVMLYTTQLFFFQLQ